jgi:hypothetical protein
MLRLPKTDVNLPRKQFSTFQPIPLMIPRNKQNRKLQMNLNCPTCGMDLTRPQIQGFVSGNETFCCQGCADGSGCTCNKSRVIRKKAGIRHGDIGQRNPENSRRDKNQNMEVDTSGRPTGIHRAKTWKVPPRQQRRGKRDASGKKLPRGIAKERTSTRAQSRGRSEFRGAMNQSRINDRVGTTGVKSR